MLSVCQQTFCNVDTCGLQTKFKEKVLSGKIEYTKFILCTVAGTGYNLCSAGLWEE